MIETVSLALSVCVGLLALPDLFLIAVHLRQRKQRLEQERHEIDTFAVLLTHAPEISVQVPVHNEAAHIGEAIRSLVALDWPMDKLEILILDDCSNDGTGGMADEAAASWSAKGINVRVLHRTDRTGYKAGVLAAGMQASDAPFIALFDVDCWPDKLWLRQLMAIMVSNPRLAFVQARLEHRNRDQNWLTRAQALELDSLFAYEHAARNWAEIPITFNGSCAIWRRQAIEEAGGWLADTLSEDHDLSYRAAARGWTGRFLVSVAVAGQLPSSLAALTVQRLRWGIGIAQQFRISKRAMLKTLKLRPRLLFLGLSLFHAVVQTLIALAAVSLVACWALDPSRAATPTIAFAVGLGAIVVTKSIGAALAAGTIGRSLGGRFWADLILMWLLQLYLLPTAWRGQVEALKPGSGEFVRTPK